MFKSKLIIAVLAIFVFTAFIPNEASAKRIKIHKVLTDQNGGSWTIDGWLDISIVPPSVDDWDIWVIDPDGNRHHFVGGIINPNYNENTGIFSFDIILNEDIYKIEILI